MALIEAYMGTQKVAILNVSLGGLAVLFKDTPPCKPNDRLDFSISVRERPFPLPVEVRGVMGFRASCQFLSPPKAFISSLKEFLQPKYLGNSLARDPDLSKRRDVPEIVPGADPYEAFVSQNQTGGLVWTRSDRALLKLVAVSGDLALEWSEADGLKTGRMPSGEHPAQVSTGSKAPIQWNRAVDPTLLHYFADILLAWLGKETNAHQFVQELIRDSGSEEALSKLRFPRV